MMNNISKDSRMKVISFVLIIALCVTLIPILSFAGIEASRDVKDKITIDSFVITDSKGNEVNPDTEYDIGSKFGLDILFTLDSAALQADYFQEGDYFDIKVPSYLGVSGEIAAKDLIDRRSKDKLGEYSLVKLQGDDHYTIRVVFTDFKETYLEANGGLSLDVVAKEVPGEDDDSFTFKDEAYPGPKVIDGGDYTGADSYKVKKDGVDNGDGTYTWNVGINMDSYINLLNGSSNAEVKEDVVIIDELMKGLYYKGDALKIRVPYYIINSDSSKSVTSTEFGYKNLYLEEVVHNGTENWTDFQNTVKAGNTGNGSYGYFTENGKKTKLVIALGDLPGTIIDSKTWAEMKDNLDDVKNLSATRKQNTLDAYARYFNGSIANTTAPSSSKKANLVGFTLSIDTYVQSDVDLDVFNSVILKYKEDSHSSTSGSFEYEHKNNGWIITRVPGKVTIDKFDEDTNKTIDGAKFKLLKWNINKWEEIEQGAEQSTSNGSVSFDKLPAGKYKIVETGYAQGYKEGSLTIKQILFNDKGIQTGTKDLTKDTNGEIGYVFDVTAAEITAGVVFEAKNAQDKGIVQIIKKDSESGAKLAGAVFRLWRKSLGGSEYRETDIYATTNALGIATISGLVWNDYQLKEVTWPKDYVEGSGSIDNDGKFSVTAGSIKTVTVNAENDRDKGKVNLAKLDYDSGASMAGIDFYLKKLVGSDWVTVTKAAAGGGEELYKVTTDENGKASFDNLDWGYYIISEGAFKVGYEPKMIPDDKYKNNPDQRFEVTQGALTINYTAKNKLKRGSLELTKYGESKAELLAGVSFKLQIKNGTNWDDVKAGTPATTVTKTTTGNGIVTFDDLKQGTYRFVEITPAKGYGNTLTLKDKNGNAIDNEFTLNAEKLSFKVDGYNPRVRGSISLEKYSEYAKTLKVSGASFQLMKLNGSSWTAVSPEAIKTTGADGKVSWGNLDWGIYGIKEVTAGFGHTNGLKLISGFGTKDEVDGIQKLNVTSTALNLTIEGTNPTVPGKVIVKKYDVSDTAKENPLNGTEFYLKNLDDGTTTNAVKVTNGQAVFDNLKWGNYQLAESKAAEGYDKDTFNFPNDGKFTIDINDVNKTTPTIAVETLTGTNDTIKGKVVLTKLDGQAVKDPVIAGATFQLWKYNGTTWSAIGQPKQTLTNGEVAFTGLEWGDYWLVETAAAPGYKANSDWSKKPSGAPGNSIQEFTIGEIGNDVVLSITKEAINDRKEGTVLLTKVDVTDKVTKIDGAVFNLYKVGTGGTETFVTSGSSIDGVVNFSGLEWGDYKLYETKAGEGYTTKGVVFLSDNVNSIISADGVFNVNKDAIELEFKATNDRLLGSVSLEKKDTSTGAILKGAEFSLVNSKGETVATTKTGIDGKLKFENVLWDKYKLVETTATTGYDKDKLTIEPVGFTLDNEGYFEVNKAKRDFSVVAKNPKLKGSVELDKIDKTTKKELNGVEFTLLDSKNNVVETGITENGKVSFGDLAWGTYKLVETKVLDGYTTSGMIFTGTGISSEGEFTVTSTALTFGVQADNPRLGGKVELTKVDAVNKGKINGAEFNLLDKDGKIVQSGAVKNGTLEFDGLAWGKYTLVETKAPDSYTTKGMIFSGDGITSKGSFTVSGEALSFNIIADNPRLDGSIELDKIDKTSEKPLDGVEFTLLDSKNKVVGTGTTKDGKVSFDNLEWGDYKLVETGVLEGYTTSGMIYAGKGISEDGSFTVTAAALKFGFSADNPRLEGEIELTKLDADSKTKIDGAKFNLLNDSGVIVKSGVVENGTLTFDKLSWGKYQLVETKATEGYDKDTVTYLGKGITTSGSFEVTATALKFAVDAENGRVPGQLTIDKYDPINNAKLGFTEFFLQYHDGKDWNTLNSEEGTTKYGITDGNGAYTFDNLDWGQYRLIEHKAFEGYNKDTVVYSGDVSTDGSFYVTSTAVKLSVSAENERIPGELKIIKYDSTATGTALEGAVFFLRYLDENTGKFADYVDEDGVTVTAITNASGEAIFKNLPWTKYQVAELKAPKGYKEGTLKFIDGSDGVYEVTNEVRTIAVEATNDRILGTVELEKLDKIDNTKKLRGGEFTLEYYNTELKDWLTYTDESGDNVIAITDNMGKLKFKDVPWGQYRVIELIAPEGYDPATLEFEQGDNLVTVGADQQTYYLTAYNTGVLGEEAPPDDYGDDSTSDGSVLGQEAKTGDVTNMIPLLAIMLIVCLILLLAALQTGRRQQ